MIDRKTREEAADLLRAQAVKLKDKARKNQWESPIFWNKAREYEALADLIEFGELLDSRR